MWLNLPALVCDHGQTDGGDSVTYLLPLPVDTRYKTAGAIKRMIEKRNLGWEPADNMLTNSVGFVGRGANNKIVPPHMSHKVVGVAKTMYRVKDNLS